MNVLHSLIEITYREQEKKNKINRVNSRIILDIDNHTKKCKDKKKKKC